MLARKLLSFATLLGGACAGFAADPPPLPATAAPLKALPPLEAIKPLPVSDGACQTLCEPVPCCCPCGPPGRIWVRAEYIYWVARGDRVPPLATAAVPGTPQPIAGVLGVPTTQTLFGGSRANDEFRSGVRVTGGFWLDCEQTLGVEGDFLYLGESRDRAAAGSDGSRIITRPFFSTTLGRESAELVSFPGILRGTVTADTSSDFVGGGANVVKNLCCDPCGRWDVIAGYLYLSLTDEVVVREDLTTINQAGVVPGTRFQIEDRFRTENEFHGGVLGVGHERWYGRCFLSARGSVALGVTTTTTEISGFTIITPPGGPATRFPGGLLTQPSNIGRYTRDEFSVVPEARLRFGCQVTDCVRVYGGYTFLYWSQVARAGDQIDVRVNETQLAPAVNPVGPLFPAFRERRTGYWVQGVSVGLEARF